MPDKTLSSNKLERYCAHVTEIYQFRGSDHKNFILIQLAFKNSCAYKIIRAVIHYQVSVRYLFRQLLRSRSS